MPKGLSPLRWLALAFIFSRIVYYSAGIRFDASPVDTYWQYIDPVLMRTDLLRSLWYLHMQPPGFNLWIGLTVKLFPEAYPIVWQLLYLVIGWTIGWSIFKLLSLFGVSEKLALGITILFVVSPGLVLYENFLIYEYPIIVLLQLSALALYKFVEQPSTPRALWFFGLLGSLMYIRNLFHLAYLVLVIVAMWWFLRTARKQILWGALPAFLLNLGLYFKNWALFGTFVASSWAGMATGVTTTVQMSPAEVEPLIASGDLTPVARITPFSPLAEYTPFFSAPAPTGIPVLDQAETSTGHPNYNHLGYLPVHAAYVKNAQAVLQKFPQAYLRSVMIAWFSYFLPLSDLHSFDVPRKPIETFDRIWSAVFTGQFLRAPTRGDLRALKANGQAFLLPLYTGTFLIVLLPALNLWAGWRLWSQWRGGASMTAAQTAVWAFAWITLLFVTLVSNSLSSFEGNRYRFPIDGFYVLFLGTSIEALWKRFGRA
jgi:hypothetical protein